MGSGYETHHVAEMAVKNIPIIYSRIILSALEKPSSDTRRLLQAARLENTGGFMSVDQYRALLALVRQISGDPLIALKAGANVPFSVHGPLGIAAMSAATLGAAVETIHRYAVLRSPFCTTRFMREGDQFAFTFEISNDLGAQSDAALDFIIITIVHSIMSWISAPLRSPRLELVRQQPPCFERYQNMLGCPTVYARSRNALIIHRDDLSIPMLGANQDEFDAALERLRTIYLTTQKPESIRDAVISVFVSKSGHLCSLQETACEVCTSSRTLQRRLGLAGTTFHRLRDEWLAQQAESYLIRERLPVDVIATLLGYTEVANFRRSFKRWFGTNPARYRAANQRL